MSDNVRVHIGSPEDMGRRFVDAWHRAEHGEAAGETNITFHDLETLLAALTPKRLHLLRWLLSRTPGQVVAPYAEVNARFVL